MPQSPPLLDLASLDLSQVVVSLEEVREVNPHRPPFEMIDGIVHFEPEKNLAVGLRDVHADEFWVPGHIPGRPLFPGVLQAEAAAQVCSFVYQRCFPDLAEGFFGFAGLEEVRFSSSVVPGDRLHIVAVARRMKRRLAIFDTQAFVGDRMVFEGVVKGALM